ncbi:MAG: LON peptidase substrate-binding domain-containing protein [Flavobacteriales bacterium]
MNSSQLHTGIFPLGVFLMPGETIPLHISEPRYKQLVNMALNSDLPFTIIYFQKGKKSEYGSLVHVTKVVNRYNTGDLDIIVTCKKNVKIIRTYSANEDNQYQSAVVNTLSLPPYEVSKGVKLAYIDYLNALEHSSLEINRDEIKAVVAIAEMTTAYDLLSVLNLSHSQKLNWVKHQLSGNLDEYILKQLRILTRLMEQEKTESGFYLN